jgi:hypothetical protein
MVLFRREHGGYRHTCDMVDRMLGYPARLSSLHDGAVPACPRTTRLDT